MLKEQSRVDNQEKLAILGTQCEDQQNNNTKQYVLDTTFTQTNTNNVNKYEPSYKQLDLKTIRTSFLCEIMTDITKLN